MRALRAKWWSTRVSVAIVLAAGSIAITYAPAMSQELDAAVVIDGTLVFPDAAEDVVDVERLPGGLRQLIARSDHARFVQIDVDIVRRELDVGQVRIEVEPGTQIEVDTIYAERDMLGATIWTAQGIDGSALALVTRGTALTGDLQLNGRRWGIAQVSDQLHVIFEHRAAPGPADVDAIVVPQPKQPPLLSPLPKGFGRFAEELADTDDIVTTAAAPGLPPLIQPMMAARAAAPPASVIDVLVVYEDTALALHGTTTAVENLIIGNVASANAGLATSAIDATLNLVYVGHESYVGSGSSFNDLTRLRNKYDGHLDTVHALRDTNSADLVVLVSALADGTCGRANLLQVQPVDGTDDEAFSVVGASCLANSTFVHEVGHNMGAAHDDANTSGLNGIDPFSRGWVDVANNFVTVMSYANTNNGCAGCSTINQFSSTTELFSGNATGDIDHANATTLEASRTGIAAYRPDPCPNPANDDYPVRAVLPSASLTSTTGTTVCASIEDLETYFIGDEPVESVWYEWTAPFAGTATVSTCDVMTDFDTTVTIYDDSPLFSALSVLAYNDDAGAGCAIDAQHSQALVAVTDGQTIRFKVDGDGSASGVFDVTVTIDGTCNGAAVTVYLDRGESPTAGDDVILGTPGDDVIVALAGNDTICAGGGNDAVNTGPGNDVAFGEGGNDGIFGLDGNDVLDGGPGLDEIIGGPGLDTISGGDGADTLNGGPDADVINGGAGDDNIFGQGGDDTINGGAGNDFIIGVAGNDTINGDAGLDIINGGPDNDIISGGDDGDIIYGLGGDDQITGDGGNDFVFGQLGNDTIDGGLGADMLWGNEADDVMTDPAGANTINGGAGNDTITGGSGNDNIFGDGNLLQAGNDIIDGGLGQDLLIGFAGDDSITSNDGVVDTVNGGPSGPAGDTCVVDIGVDTVYNCEN